jgi:PAS domain S-box-containing protein
MTISFHNGDAETSSRPARPGIIYDTDALLRKSSESATQSLVRKFTREYLFLSLIPVVTFFICTVLGALFSERYIADLIHRSNYQLGEYAKKQLEEIGQAVIRNRAKDVAAQVELFLRFNPHLDVAQLQHVESFKSLALQTVGLSGYTCMYEAGTGVMRVHPNADLADRDMRFLSEKLPAWWAIFEPSLAGQESSGYYDWIEPDGRVRSKYMAMTPVAVNVQGRTLMIAATTYIDEFSVPVLTMHQKSEAVDTDYQRFIAKQVVLIGSIIAVILSLTLIAVYSLSQRAARRFIYPIVHLADAAVGFGEGQLDIEDASVILDRPDEIGALGRAFRRMRLQIKGQIKKLENNYSQLKSTQEALKKSETHYRSLFNNLPIGLYRTTPSGLVLDANPMLVQMFGYPDKETFLARRAEELYVSAETREEFKRAAGRHYECQMRRYDGTTLWVENQSTVFRDSSGQVQYYEGSIKDITERKLSEEALRNSEARFRTAFENASVGMTLVDLQGVYLEVNLALAKMLGYRRSDMIGRPVTDFTHADDLSLRSQFVKNLLEGRISSGEHERRFVHKDGSTVWTSIWASLHRDQNGRPLYFISLVQDLTARKKADEERGKLESQLLQAQKMEAIGSLAGGIAHDFNNILSAIIGYTELSLLSEGAPVDYLQEALKAANRAKDLVKQILSFSRQTDEERIPVQVGMVVKEVAKFLRASIPATIDIHCHTDEDAGSVLANSVELHQILMNLCTNAVHAIGSEAGSVGIRVRRAEITAGQRHAFPDLEPGCYVELSVEDSGQGIRSEIMERIFDPYFTTKEKGVGTGLGLAVVHGIVKKSNGTIRVASRLGQGSVFSIYLPQIELRSVASPAPSAPLQGGSGRILFVDDERMIADIGERILRRLGYEVVSRTSPAAALEVFKAEPRAFDLVISDQTMPGLTGDALAGELMRINPEIPVILCTGYSQLIDAQKAKEKGIQALVMKPILINEMDEAIRRVLQKDPPEPERPHAERS